MVKFFFYSIFIFFFIWSISSFSGQELVRPHWTCPEIMVWITRTRFRPRILRVLRSTWMRKLVTKTNLGVFLHCVVIQSRLTLHQLIISIRIQVFNTGVDYRAGFIFSDKEILYTNSVSLLFIHKVALSIPKIAVLTTYCVRAVVVVFLLLLFDLLDYLYILRLVNLIIWLVLQQDVLPDELQEIPSWPVLLARIPLSNTFEPGNRFAKFVHHVTSWKATFFLIWV